MTLSAFHKIRNPPLNSTDLEELLRRSRTGDAEAFNRIIDVFYSDAYGLAYRILCDRDAAEDATQEIFLKAWERLRQFRGAARFSTWLHSIAVRHCLDLCRKRSREATHRSNRSIDDEQEIEIWRDHRNDSPGLDWEEKLAIREALAKLPEKLRVVVTLRYYVGYTIEEIAGALELPPNTVRSRLYLSMERLRRLLGESEEF